MPSEGIKGDEWVAYVTLDTYDRDERGIAYGVRTLWRRSARSSRRSRDLPGRTIGPSAGRRGTGDRTYKDRKVCEMQNAETVLGVLRERTSRHRSLESPLRGNSHGGFGGRPHGKGSEPQTPRRAAHPSEFGKDHFGLAHSQVRFLAVTARTERDRHEQKGDPETPEAS